MVIKNLVLKFMEYKRKCKAKKGEKGKDIT